MRVSADLYRSGQVSNEVPVKVNPFDVVQEDVQKAILSNWEIGQNLRPAHAKTIVEKTGLASMLAQLHTELRPEERICRVRLFIEQGLSVFHDIPWEAIDWRTYLGRNEVWFSRNAAGSTLQPVRSRIYSKPSLLFAAAQGNSRRMPKGLPPINADMIEALRSRLAAKTELDDIGLESGTKRRQSVNLDRIHRSLSRNSNILCLIAHGNYKEETDTYTIYLEDDKDPEQIVLRPVDEVITKLQGTLPPLVVLISCFSAGGRDRDPLSSLAWRLASECGVRAVLAMHDKIDQALALEFVDNCIKHLTSSPDDPIDKALALARHEMQGSRSSDDTWAQPILYMQVQDGLLWHDSRLERLSNWLGSSDRYRISPKFGIALDFNRTADDRRRIDHLASVLLQHSPWLAKLEIDNLERMLLSSTDFYHVLFHLYCKDTSADHAQFQALITAIKAITKTDDLAPERYLALMALVSLINELITKKAIPDWKDVGQHITKYDHKAYFNEYAHPYKDELSEGDIISILSSFLFANQNGTHPLVAFVSNFQRNYHQEALTAWLNRSSALFGGIQAPQQPPEEVRILVLMTLIYEISPDSYEAEFWVYEADAESEPVPLDVWYEGKAEGDFWSVQSHGETNLQQIRMHFQHVVTRFRANGPDRPADWPSPPDDNDRLLLEIYFPQHLLLYERLVNWIDEDKVPLHLSHHTTVRFLERLFLDEDKTWKWKQSWRTPAATFDDFDWGDLADDAIGDVSRLFRLLSQKAGLVHALSHTRDASQSTFIRNAFTAGLARALFIYSDDPSDAKQKLRAKLTILSLTGIPNWLLKQINDVGLGDLPNYVTLLWDDTERPSSKQKQIIAGASHRSEALT